MTVEEKSEFQVCYKSDLILANSSHINSIARQADSSGVIYSEVVELSRWQRQGGGKRMRWGLGDPLSSWGPNSPHVLTCYFSRGGLFEWIFAFGRQTEGRKFQASGLSSYDIRDRPSGLPDGMGFAFSQPICPKAVGILGTAIPEHLENIRRRKLAASVKAGWEKNISCQTDPSRSFSTRLIHS